MRYNTIIALILLVSSIIYNAIVGFSAEGIWLNGVLVTLYGFNIYMDHIKKPDFSKSINESLQRLEDRVNVRLDTVSKENEQAIKEVNTKVGEVRLAASPAKTKETALQSKYRF